MEAVESEKLDCTVWGASPGIENAWPCGREGGPGDEGSEGTVDEGF